VNIDQENCETARKLSVRNPWKDNCGISGVSLYPLRRPGRVTLLAAGVVATAAAGNSLLRVGLSSAPPLLSFTPSAFINEFTSLMVVAGVVFLIANMILQLSLLSWADLTYTLPVTSPSYVLITVIGALGLREHVSLAHWAGVLLILFGVIIVGRTRPLTAGGSR